MASKAEKLIGILEPLAEENGLELVTVEIAGTTKNPILRVYLDTPEGGINLDQLAAAQQWVDAKVEELDPFKESYVLEVSSPGIDRPLRKLEDFCRYAGEDVVIYVKNGKGQKKEAGVLSGVEGEDVVIGQDGERKLIAHADIKRAHIVGRIDFGGKKDKKSKAKAEKTADFEEE